LEKQWEIPADISEEEIREYAKIVASEFEYGTNMRGSAKYRQHLAEVLIFREMRSIITEGRAWK
jgi:putative selenate reductase FAD-binding subunit